MLQVEKFMKFYLNFQKEYARTNSLILFMEQIFVLFIKASSKIYFI